MESYDALELLGLMSVLNDSELPDASQRIYCARVDLRAG